MSQNVPNVPLEVGNTNQLPKKQQVAYLKWCFTHNLGLEKPTEDELFNLIVPIKNRFIKICNFYIFSLEKGENNGRFHLQGYIEFRNKKRLNCVKKLIDDTTHWEKTKGSKEQNIDYCNKEPLYTWKWDRKHDEKEFTAEQLDLITEDMLYYWQYNIIHDIIEKKPKKRIIYWFYSIKGEMGKTEFAKYLIYHYNAQLVNGNNKDIMCQIIGPTAEKPIKPIYLFNIAKCKDKISYEALENLKDGLICSSKYEGGSKIIPVPHIIVFSNFLPELDKMSKGRFAIKCVDNQNIKIEDCPKIEISSSDEDEPDEPRPLAMTSSTVLKKTAEAVKLSRPSGSPSRFRYSCSESSDNKSSDNFMVEF